MKVLREGAVMNAREDKAELIKIMLKELGFEKVTREKDRVCGDYPSWAHRLCEDLVDSGWSKANIFLSKKEVA